MVYLYTELKLSDENNKKKSCTLLHVILLSSLALTHTVEGGQGRFAPPPR